MAHEAGTAPIRSQARAVVLAPKDPVPEITGGRPCGTTHGGSGRRATSRNGANRGTARRAYSSTTERSLFSCRHIRAPDRGEEHDEEKN
jgi:hypothetical protein